MATNGCCLTSPTCWARAAVLALSDPKARLAAFQDEDVMTRGEEQYPDDFFGSAESI